MGKSEEKQIKQRAHKATDSESKHKNKPSFDATNFEATDKRGTHDSRWHDHFRQLCGYKVQFGHCRVPQKYTANPKLGSWVQKQRTRYREFQEGKASPMTKQRIRDLEIIRFDWGTSRTDSETIWSMRFQQLLEFKSQYGHCVVPIKYTAHPKLGSWVSSQRYQYRLYKEGKSSAMTEERVRELESLGVEWLRGKTNYSTSIWSVRLQEIREFKMKFGHCLVPQQYAANPMLGHWVSDQRRNYELHQEGKPSTLTEERLRELERVGVEWGTSKTD